MMKIKKIKNS